MAIGQIDFSKQTISSGKTTLILGAGASYPLPTADDIKRALVDAALEYAFSGDDSNISKMSARINEVLNYPFFTLEALFALFRYRLNKFFPADEIIDNSLNISSINLKDTIPGFPKTTELSLLLGSAMNRDDPIFNTIITSNFDDSLEAAQELIIDHRAPGKSLKYNVITAAQSGVFRAKLNDLLENGGNNTIVHFHGTICESPRMRSSNNVLEIKDDEPRRKYMGKFSKGYSDPSTMFARGLARPFSEEFGEFIKEILIGSEKIIFYGYRGADEYDFNLVLEDIISDKESGGEFKTKIQWYSYRGDGTDLSDFVRNEFAGQIVAGDFIGQLRNIIDPDDREFVNNVNSRAIRDQSALNAKIKANLKLEILKIWRSLDVPVGDVRDVILDIYNNVVGAWASMEHYYLESMGYDQNRIFSFGGSRAAGQGKFLDVDFSNIVDGQRIYRYEQQNTPAIEHVINNGLINIHKKSFSIFKNLENETKTALEVGHFGRDVDRAIVLVGRAVAVDYQGLILRARAARSEKFNSPTLSILTTDLAKRAEFKFRECKFYSDLAAAAVGRDHNSDTFEYIDELVGWRRWQTIAMDNIPRAVEFYDRNMAMEQYLSVIELRHRQFLSMIDSGQDFVDSVSPGAEFAPAHLPQLLLRISEYIKNFMNIDSANREKFSKKVVEWIEKSRSLMKDSRELSSLPNDRLISLLEAISYFAIEYENVELQDYVSREVSVFRGKLKYRKCGEYVENWRKALTKPPYAGRVLTEKILVSLPTK